MATRCAQKTMSFWCLHIFIDYTLMLHLASAKLTFYCYFFEFMAYDLILFVERSIVYRLRVKPLTRLAITAGALECQE